MALNKFLIAIVLTALSVSNCIAKQESETRIWTSKDGKYKVEARVEKIDGETVFLITPQGKSIELKASALSKSDQAFLGNMNSDNSTPNRKKRSTDKELREKLAKFDIRVSNGELALIGESKLKRGLSECKKTRKQLNQNNKLFDQAKQQEMGYQLQIKQLTALNFELNAQLANVGRNDVNTNNRLVGAINANQSKMQLANGELQGLQKQLKQARAEMGQQRSEYIQNILDLRRTAIEIENQRAELKNQPEVKSLIAEFSQQTGERAELIESRSFTRYLKRLKDLEDTVLTETIPLRTDGRSIRVTVSLNGDHTTEMFLDSGSSLICLPYTKAFEFGLQPNNDDPDIQIKLADGRLINGKLIKIAKVRVGKFTVADVDGVVLGPEATAAPMLLGMSFLENFKFEINAAENTLSMVKIIMGE